MPWGTQSVNDDVRVQVNAGRDHKSGRDTTDFIIAYRDGSGDREHVTLDAETGDVIHDTTGSA